jgi:hypothetical protein
MYTALREGRRAAYFDFDNDLFLEKPPGWRRSQGAQESLLQCRRQLGYGRKRLFNCFQEFIYLLVADC